MFIPGMTSSSYLWVLLAMLLAFGAQMYLSSTYGRYSRIRNARNLTGAEVARDILDANGLHNVPVEMTPGQLTDHYDPVRKVLRLSEGNYSQPSLAALAVAAHEAGHAIQDARSYAPLRARAQLFPVLSFGSNFGPWMIIAGLIFNFTSLAWLGLLFFAGALLFHLVTLPVEFDASRRALAILEGNGYLSRQENAGARTVLNAAALTYVVGFLIALAQVMHYLMLLLGSSRRDE
ncbi:MAG TPA: zinc metallopeptidase [Deinococcales bacterium]|nr:zinc metallopeptidase [Deinococcales bacterium]